MASVHEQTIEIRELATKKVTLYPTKAEIIREIGDVKLRPGVNEICVTGITPIADENSIKIEAHGSTTVTDMVVELVDNSDAFEDVYPLYSDDSDEDESDSEAETPEDIKDLETSIDKLLLEHEDLVETINNNNQSLQMLEGLINKYEFKNPEEMSSTMQIYQQRRYTYYVNLSKAKESKSAVDQKLTDLKKQKQKLQEKHEKEHLKSLIKKERARKKAAREQAKAKEAERRDIAEKARFWPKKIYKIKVTIEWGVITPGTSRRGSFDSLATVSTPLTDESRAQPTTTSLLLTYIVNGASWIPKYDLNISTVTETGLLNYSAEVLNNTSETWREAKVILCTSRAAFAKVSEPIPVIRPWMLHLVKSGTFGTSNSGAALSHQEQVDRIRSTDTDNISKPYLNNNLFGVSEEVLQNYHVSQEHPLQKYELQLRFLEQQSKQRWMLAEQEKQVAVQQQRAQLSQVMQQQVQQAIPPPPGAAVAPTGAVFGGAAPPPAPRGGSLFGSAAAKPSFGASMAAPLKRRKEVNSKDESAKDYEAEVDEDEEEASSSSPNSEAEWEESGLTTTLELRGARTIVPSTSARKFKIAAVRLNQLSLTHIVAPKLRAEAFLRARIVNTSPTALLKGAAGLTLDGTFLGQTTIPRCSQGENFPLPLGVDPAISVSYPTPISRKNRDTGMFTKELSDTFSRAVVLTNTRSGGAAVSIIVRDQIPVSEDERLKIEILAPRGLQEEGDKAKAGVEYLSAHTAKVSTTSGTSTDRSSSSSKTSSQNWGLAIAKLSKFGAVEWTVSLNPGKAVRLNLEYIIRYPGTERPVESFKSGSSPFRS